MSKMYSPASNASLVCIFPKYFSRPIDVEHLSFNNIYGLDSLRGPNMVRLCFMTRSASQAPTSVRTKTAVVSSYVCTVATERAPARVPMARWPKTGAAAATTTATCFTLSAPS